MRCMSEQTDIHQVGVSGRNLGGEAGGAGDAGGAGGGGGGAGGGGEGRRVHYKMWPCRCKCRCDWSWFEMFKKRNPAAPRVKKATSLLGQVLLLLLLLLLL